MRSPQGKSNAAVGSFWDVSGSRSVPAQMLCLGCGTWLSARLCCLGANGMIPMPSCGDKWAKHSSWGQCPWSVLEPHLTMEQQILPGAAVISCLQAVPGVSQACQGTRSVSCGFFSLQEKCEVSLTFGENYSFSTADWNILRVCLLDWSFQDQSNLFSGIQFFQSASFLSN